MSECILWTGSLYPSGYGQGKNPFTGKQGGAHRIAYIVAYGPIPDGLHVDHVCHTNDLTCNAGNACPHRRCVNPEHMELVTPAENIRRGRKTKRDDEPFNCGHPRVVDGKRRKICPVCHAVKTARWYRAHEEELREYRAAYYAENREELKAAQRERNKKYAAAKRVGAVA